MPTKPLAPLVASRPPPTVTPATAAQLPADDPGARQLALSDSRATERPLDASIAVSEVLGFPFVYLAGLPAGWSLDLLQLDGSQLTITSRQADYTRIRNTGGNVVSKLWVWPMSLAAEHGRGNRVTLADWLTRASRESHWQLTPEHVFAGVPGRFDSLYWSTHSVCKAYGLTLMAVS